MPLGCDLTRGLVPLLSTPGTDILSVILFPKTMDNTTHIALQSAASLSVAALDGHSGGQLGAG
jgi:hypothetical protein